jgi:hypothetical protein
LREISHQFVLHKHVDIMKSLKKMPIKRLQRERSFLHQHPQSLITYTLIAFENVLFSIHGVTKSDLCFLARVSGEAGGVLSQLQQHCAI